MSSSFHLKEVYLAIFIILRCRDRIFLLTLELCLSFTNAGEQERCNQQEKTLISILMTLIHFCKFTVCQFVGKKKSLFCILTTV
jgi:hypothetical protein